MRLSPLCHCCLARSVMHRHPEAAKALRRAVVRPLMQEGILMYARAARWLDARRAAGAGLLQCVPGKQQLGGDFITDRRLRRCSSFGMGVWGLCQSHPVD